MTAAVEAVLFDVDDTLFDRAAAQEKVLDLLGAAFPDLLGGHARADLSRAFADSGRLRRRGRRRST